MIKSIMNSMIWMILIAVLVVQPTGTVRNALCAEEILLVGAAQGAADHIYSQVLQKFAERVKSLSPDTPVRFEIYYNGQRGLEKDYFFGMVRGYTGKNRVDFSMVAPSHMSNLVKSAAFMDTPFLFRDTGHWRKCMDSNMFAVIEKEIEEKADILVLGYAGGGVRNIFSPKPLKTAADFDNVIIRVMSAPIQSKIFSAIGMLPRPMQFSEIRESLEKNRIQAAENEAAGIMDQKFYEVAPEVTLTRHSITVRPLCFSGKLFRKLPEKLQAAILKAGVEATIFGRTMESESDAKRLSDMADSGKIRLHELSDRKLLLEKAEIVKKSYAETLGVSDVLSAINKL